MKRGKNGFRGCDSPRAHHGCSPAGKDTDWGTSPERRCLGPSPGCQRPCPRNTGAFYCLLECCDSNTRTPFKDPPKRTVTQSHTGALWLGEKRASSAAPSCWNLTVGLLLPFHVSAFSRSQSWELDLEEPQGLSQVLTADTASSCSGTRSSNGPHALARGTQR